MTMNTAAAFIIPSYGLWKYPLVLSYGNRSCSLVSHRSPNVRPGRGLVIELTYNHNTYSSSNS